MRLLGDIGQPEILIPILSGSPPFHLNCFSPVTSPLHRGNVRSFRNISLRKISIAKSLSGQRSQKVEKSLATENGTLLFAPDLHPHDFADIYTSLHAARWGLSADDLTHVTQQIVSLYKYVQGGVLLFNGEPVAALLAFAVSCKSILYFDFVNSGVKLKKTSRASAGTILLLKCISRAQELAGSEGKVLRFSLGYEYGDESYKRQWGVAEDTFLAY